MGFNQPSFAFLTFLLLLCYGLRGTRGAFHLISYILKESYVFFPFYFLADAHDWDGIVAFDYIAYLFYVT
jgi:hypothetical protein